MPNIVRTPYFTAVILISLFITGLPFMALAGGEDGTFSVGLSTGFSQFLSGDAGNGVKSPEYEDLFKAGYGFALEAEYPLCEYASLLGGVAYEKFSGKNYEGLNFDDLEIIPVYVGGKLYVPVKSSLKPYFMIGLGISYFSDASVSWDSISNRYWDSSWVFTGHAGMGFNYTVNSWTFSGDVKFRYMGAPDNNLSSADADGSWSLPVSIGASYAF